MIYLVELHCPVGHANFIRGVIDQHAKENVEITLVSYEGYRKKIDRSVPFISVGEMPKDNNRKILRRIELIRKVRRLRKIAPKSEMIFLSYDPYVMALSGLRNCEISLYEHNNIDRADESRLYRLFYRLLPKCFVHLCFEDYIAAYVSRRYTKITKVVSHPKRLFNCDQSATREYGSLDKYFFCPTECHSRSRVDAALRYFAEQDATLLLKDRSNITSGLHQIENLVTSSYFDQYEEIFMAAHGVVILNDYSHRISAVFYEAIVNKKPVVIQDSLFARAAKSKYRSHDIKVVDFDS